MDGCKGVHAVNCIHIIIEAWTHFKGATGKLSTSFQYTAGHAATELAINCHA